MNTKQTQPIHPFTFVAAGLSVLLGIVFVSAQLQSERQQAEASSPLMLHASATPPDPTDQTALNEHRGRVALRLQARLLKHGYAVPPAQKLVEALQAKKHYLQADGILRLTLEGVEQETEWPFNFHRFPLWLTLKTTKNSAEYVLAEDRITAYLQEFGLPGVTPPNSITVQEVVQVGSVLRAKTDGIGQAGWSFDTTGLSTDMAKVLESGSGALHLRLPRQSPTFVDTTDSNIEGLQLLATGRSDFAGSTWGRSMNVQKAIGHHVNNIVVPQGETFSFNRTLENTLSDTYGWKIAKVIVNGSELKDEPGGGICQASTTVYRAIIDGGFPVVKRKSHSLYVHYYEQYGVGIDATVYYGEQDLTFVNDTPGPLFIQSYVDGTEVFVHFYGVPDGRRVTTEGPYFSTNAPSDLMVNGRPLRANEIVWLQKVHYADGTTREEQIVSAYRSIPRYVITKHGMPTVAQEPSVASAL